MTEMSHREIAVSFLKLAASGKVREAYSKYVSPDFRHHNPFFRGDRESLILAMEENATENPNKKLVHIFRFEGDHIVEMWDIGQAVPEDSPNENGMF